jgi:quinol-cytochrome oxidoreductase complex cytochrome b subunit
MTIFIFIGIHYFKALLGALQVTSMITIGTSGFTIFIMYVVVSFLGYSIPGNALVVNGFYVGCNLLGAMPLIGKGLVY